MNNPLGMNFSLAAQVPPGQPSSATQALAAKGLEALDKGRFERANEYFNSALRLDLANSEMHLLNALSYHLRGKSGDARSFELAEQGYQQALRFDPTNSLATYYLGLAYLDQRKFSDAQTKLAAAAVLDDSDTDILYDLAVASYYAGDARTSKAAIDKAMELGRDGPEVLQAAVMSNAAAGDLDAAKALLGKMKDAPRTHNRLAKRVAAWSRLHQEADTGILKRNLEQRVQALPGGTRTQRSTPTFVPPRTNTRGGPSALDLEVEPQSEDMVFVDVIIIRTQEEVSTNRGLNLLSGLELQFGDPLTNTPGASWTRGKTTDLTGGGGGSDTRAISRAISIPSVNYSLNIFNTLDGRNEILASPSLVALDGERSEFFSGVDVVAAAVSGGDGSSISVNKQVGVKLGVTPEFLETDRIKLEVEAERTFLTNPSSSVQFEFRLDTSNTNVNANVVMEFGETLILSGLSEKETEESRDAVPLLGDIPLLQYGFSNQRTSEFRKSVLIMLTPRRPEYTNRSHTARHETEHQLSEFEKSLSTFESRNKNWFVPRSTAQEMLIVSSRTNALFNEYRTGDLALERWNSRATHEQRLSQAVNFLFY
ncbi:hypothetical protein ACS3SW_16850 [Roseobacteraceae bacterium S113]